MFGWRLRMFSRNAPLPVPQPSLRAGRGRGRAGSSTLREVDRLCRQAQPARQAACRPAARCSAGHSFFRDTENTCHAARPTPSHSLVTAQAGPGAPRRVGAAQQRDHSVAASVDVVASAGHQRAAAEGAGEPAVDHHGAVADEEVAGNGA